MIANGKSNREIEEFLGLTGNRPEHNLLKREMRKEKKPYRFLIAIILQAKSL